jgi:hypothetical protein
VRLVQCGEADELPAAVPETATNQQTQGMSMSGAAGHDEMAFPFAVTVAAGTVVGLLIFCRLTLFHHQVPALCLVSFFVGSSSYYLGIGSQI